jgi:ankyrin repeat protein
LGYLTLNEKLYVAIHENDLYKARQLLSHGASSSYIPIDYKTIFTHLIKNNNEIKNYYIETSLFASILASDSMLYMAVSNNNFNLVKELINYHNYGQIGQHTEVVSLCLAVKHCYMNIVEYLIDYGHINPNDCVQVGCKHCKTQSDDLQRYQFPLYRKYLLFFFFDFFLNFFILIDACRENHLDLVKYLIQSKQCDINQLTTSYETCLHGAILGAIENRFDSSSNNQQRYHIVEYLLKRSDCNPDLGMIKFFIIILKKDKISKTKN